MTETRRRLSPRRRQALALGGLAAAGLTLAACDNAPDGDFAFTSVSDCRNAGLSEVVCQEEYQAALRNHVETAPRYDALQACEAEFGEGRCSEVVPRDQAGGTQQSFFMPFLTGYLVSSALRNVVGYGGYRDYRARNAGYAPAPIYRDRAGRSVTTVPGREPGVRPTTRPLNANTRTAARSGFGGRSFSRGFGG